MIRNLLITLPFIFGLSQPAFSAHHDDHAGVKKTKEKDSSTSKPNPKAEADAALKRVEAMTRKARGQDPKKDKKDKKAKK